MDNRPIGVFDSGVGGLTVMKELISILPHEDFIYFGDTARVPYGSHSKETIINFAKQDLDFLLSKDVKAVLVACGTVSSTSLEVLRKMTDIPIVGVIAPAAEKAAQIGTSVAVLATQATISSHAYYNEIINRNGKMEVFEQACPLFVPLIENGYIDDGIVLNTIVMDYVEPLCSRKIDSVILGCTHYPIIRNTIQRVFPNSVIIEAGREAATEMLRIIQNNGISTNRMNSGTCKYYASEKTDSFNTICKLFIGGDFNENIELLKLE